MARPAGFRSTSMSSQRSFRKHRGLSRSKGQDCLPRPCREPGPHSPRPHATPTKGADPFGRVGFLSPTQAFVRSAEKDEPVQHEHNPTIHRTLILTRLAIVRTRGAKGPCFGLGRIGGRTT